MYTVRKAIPSDARSIAGIYVDSWRNTYAALLPETLLIGLNTDDHERRRWRHELARRSEKHVAFVAEVNRHGVIGCASGGLVRNRQIEHDGEVHTLHVADEYRGFELGQRLFPTFAAQQFKAHVSSLIVWILLGNPARYCYEALGGKLVAHCHAKIGGAPIEEIGFAWEDVRSLIALGRPDEDELIGRA